MSENITKAVINKPKLSSRKSPQPTNRINSSSFVLIEKKSASGIKKTPLKQSSKPQTLMRSNSSVMLDESFSNVSLNQSMQTEFNNPNQTLRDLSTNAGGTSSVFQRKDSTGKEFYVPLKRRLMERHMINNSGPVDAKNSIKKIQVNLNDRDGSKSATRIQKT